MTDKDLVKNFIETKGRHLSAFNNIVKKYDPMVYGASLKYLRNAEFAEEVSQEVFLKVYSKLDKLKKPEQLKSWILRITINTCTDFYRKQKRSKEIREATLRELSLDLEVEEKPNHKIDLLRDAIEELQEDERDIIILHYFSDMKVSEIAEQFNLGESAIKMRLHRTRDKILKIMNKKGDFNV